MFKDLDLDQRSFEAESDTNEAKLTDCLPNDNQRSMIQILFSKTILI